MHPSSKPYHALRAADVMTRSAMLIPHRMSLRRAALLLCRQSFRAAPVTDELGRCVGVLSAADLLRWITHGEGPEGHGSPCFWSDWQVVEARPTGQDEVRRHLTEDPVLVAPVARLAEVVQHLRDPHRPCVIVVDGRRQPVGIVSRLELLAVMTPSEPRRSGEEAAAAGSHRTRKIGERAR